jgi:hypothetical protein
MRAVHKSTLSMCCALALVAGISATGGLAEINLELRAVPEACAARILTVSLYAVSDTAENQSIAAMNVILSWDPAVLQLRGTDNSGPYPYGWSFSGFSNDHGLDGLNDTWEDGNAWYTARAQLGDPPVPAWATPEGLLVVTFKFRKLHVGTPTTVAMPPSMGLYSHTVVYDGVVPGLDVTGTLTPASVLPLATGDLDCDGVIGFRDINPFVLILSNPTQWQAHYPGCDFDNGDINCDGSVNFRDINPFVALLSG